MPETENWQCELTEIKLMSTWIQEDTKECRPCVLHPVGAQYLAALKEAGHQDLANKVKNAFSTGIPITAAEALDNAKEEIKNNKQLLGELKKFDCMGQTYAKDT